MGTHERLGMRDNPSVSRWTETQLAEQESAKNYMRTARASSLCTCNCDQLGYALSDALVSLTKGLLPASLLPPPQIRDIVLKMEQTGWFPAISKSDMSAYYEFELVKSAKITSKGLHIELEIPFHYSYAK